MDSPDIALIYAGPDDSFAAALAAQLRSSLCLSVDTDRGRLREGECLLDRMDAFWHANVTLVLLSPESIPKRWIGEQWQRALWTEPEESGVAVCCLQTAPCYFPESLRRRRPTYTFFDARSKTNETGRSVHRWIIDLRTETSPRSFLPSENAFPADPAHVAAIREAVVDQTGVLCIAGEGPVGKSDLAAEVARQFYPEFEEVFWISCCGRTEAEIATDLAPGMDAHRCLLVLDGADSGETARLAARGRSSTLITTRLAMPLPGLQLGRSDNRQPLDEERASLLSVCRAGYLLPHVLSALEISTDGLPMIDRVTNVRRAPGWVHDLTLPENTRVSLELRHARAVATAARADCGLSLVPDLLLAIRRMTNSGEHSSLLIELTRRACNFYRNNQLQRQAEGLLRPLLDSAWQRQDHAVIASFAADYANLLEEFNQFQEAGQWRARARRSTPGQMAFDFAVGA